MCSGSVMRQKWRIMKKNSDAMHFLWFHQIAQRAGRIQWVKIYLRKENVMNDHVDNDSMAAIPRIAQANLAKY